MILKFLFYFCHFNHTCKKVVTESKERFAIQRYIIRYTKIYYTKIYYRKETEYAGFITHLHPLLYIVTLDTEALVVP